MRDKELMEKVTAFTQRDAAVRLMIASDVAAEGLNLHHRCHRLIHFDVPWSLMLFQQRNGRIDRYGQTQNPLIHYLTTLSGNDKIRGDVRILQVLIEVTVQPPAFSSSGTTADGRLSVNGPERTRMAPPVR
jgi:superfamily II DNA/RNA helicase